MRTKEHAVTTVHSCMCTKVHCTGCTCSVHAQLKEINFIYHLEGTCTIYNLLQFLTFYFYLTSILPACSMYVHLQLYVYFLLLLISATGTSTATFYPIVYPHPSCTVDLVPTVLQQYFIIGLHLMAQFHERASNKLITHKKI